VRKSIRQRFGLIVLAIVLGIGAYYFRPTVIIDPIGDPGRIAMRLYQIWKNMILIH
jgi:hypothetical protein